MTAPWLEESRLVALLVGVGFGAALERAGLGRATTLAGQFTLRDFTVLRVLFTAILTAMLGAFVLARLGALDLARVHVPETWLLPQLAGGAIFGIGFAVAGLCPGTACVAAAAGRGDGLATAAGVLAGATLGGAMLPDLTWMYAYTARGTLLLPDVLGVSYGAAVALVVAMALLAFAAAGRIERWRASRVVAT